LLQSKPLITTLVTVRNRVGIEEVALDPFTSIVTVPAAGVAVALQSPVEQAVKDRYAALKGPIRRK
jgi:hypothetical protein